MPTGMLHCMCIGARMKGGGEAAKQTNTPSVALRCPMTLLLLCSAFRCSEIFSNGLFCSRLSLVFGVGVGESGLIGGEIMYEKKTGRSFSIAMRRRCVA
jgi:hypothetical protein